MGNVLEIEHIEVDTSTEYNKNGSIKAYEALITHTKLNKTVKVRNKDHLIYSQKYNEALEYLHSEWNVVKSNQDIGNFLDRADKLHILATESEPFDYTKFRLDKVRELLPDSPAPPIYELLPKKNDKPCEEDLKYIYVPKFHHKLLGLVKSKSRAVKEAYKRDLKRYEKKCEKIRIIEEKNNCLAREYEEKLSSYKQQREELNDKYVDILNNYIRASSEEGVSEYLKLVLDNSFGYNNLFDSLIFEVDYDKDDSTAIVDFRFPLEEDFPKVKEYKYVKSRKEITESLFKDKDFNDLMKRSYYSLYIAVAYELFMIDSDNHVEALVLNGYYKGIDKRLGKPFEACIMTAKFDKVEFLGVDFDNINPKDTFKYFSGKGVPDASNVTEVEPIRFGDNSRFKLIESDSVLVNLSAETNLAAMDWKDFETLIKDVFELEFREQNIEIRNTQHSNDGGIDVVAFNKNPYTGGIILLQAKRYTNTVTPEPVRALKGSMEEHKAIRGILVTTSDFGGSSREFANQHNITLINGDQLIDLFKKHNFDFHIDLAQAKLLNSN